MKKIIDNLLKTRFLSFRDFIVLKDCADEESLDYLFLRSSQQAQKCYGNKVFIRGLIEFTNYCKNNCYYCGIRNSNVNINRYRLSEDEILNCCQSGYTLGFRTFVLQGGEDLYYSDEDYVSIIQSIKNRFPDCAVTLSIGEKNEDSYKRYFDVGADRFLLRHETADRDHYCKLHPDRMSFENRVQCVKNLKKVGYQTGVGFMVGSPFQTDESLYKDLCFIKEMAPHMVGIGPFVPQKDTPFAEYSKGSSMLTLKLLAIIRLMQPNVLLPATTALETVDPMGYERGILAGANVVMINISPPEHRKDYALYDNKICFCEDPALSTLNLDRRLKSIGYRIAIDRGDFTRCVVT